MIGEDDMTVLEKMLSGQIEMSEYLYLLTSDFNLQDELNSLIPNDAIKNKEHPLWKCIAYSFLLEYDFDLYKGIIDRNKFDDSIEDNLNIWGTIHTIYSYANPNFPYTTKYYDECHLYLDVVKDIYDGYEVHYLVESIIKSVLMHTTKKGERRHIARQKIVDAFHVENMKVYPRWIQGAEWPMGANSPMRFVEQKRYNEYVEYMFIDVDTGKERTVIQYY